MAWRYRRSKSFGGFRVTATGSGLGFSFGGPLGRISVNTRGQVRQTTRIPGIGLYSTHQIAQLGHNPHASSGHSYASASQHQTAAEQSMMHAYPMTAALPVRGPRGRSIAATILLVLVEFAIGIFLMAAAASDPKLMWLAWVFLGLTSFFIGVTVVTGRRLQPGAATTQLPASAATSETQHPVPGTVSVTALDAIGDNLNIDPHSDGVVSVKVVGLVDPVAKTADVIALPVGADGLRHGVHEGLLIPSGAEWAVFCLIHAQDNPAMFGHQDNPTAVCVKVGRLSVRDVRTYAHLFQGHPVQIALYVEATPGLEHLEVRFLNRQVDLAELSTPATSDESAPAATAATSATPPLPAAGWFTNPEDGTQWRWWDGANWTTYTSPK